MLVTRAIRFSCLGDVLENSCPDEMNRSFPRQVDRPVYAGFPQNSLIEAVERLEKK